MPDADDSAPALSITGAFTVEKGRQVQEAKTASLLKRIVKITPVTGDSKYKHNGQPVQVEPFSLWSSRTQLHNYGCSVAVSLYLAFNFECCLMFLLMLVISVPSLLSNVQRSAVRAACRTETASNASSTCGYSGLPPGTMPTDNKVPVIVSASISQAPGVTASIYQPAATTTGH